MKRRILPLILALALLLCGCGRGAVYTAEYNGNSFTVDTKNQTITQGDTVYRYDIDHRGSGDSYTITYPDGATFSMSYSGAIGSGGGDTLYDDVSRLDGGILVDILRDNQPNDGAWLAGLIWIALGVFNAAAPYAAWYIGYGWRHENAEPSELYLTVTRIIGIALIIAGLLLIFIW